LKQQKILLIDDKPANLAALSYVLEDVVEEYAVNLVKCDSGADGLKEVLKGDVSLILCDVQMPEMDGYEVANLIKHSRAHRDIPIIFLTAIHKDAKNILKGYECGAVDFLFKPFEPTVLLTKVKIFLELDRKRRQLEMMQNLQEHILQAVGEGIIYLSDNGMVQFANPLACELLGRIESRIVGYSIMDFLDLALQDEDLLLTWEATKACQQNRLGTEAYTGVAKVLHDEDKAGGVMVRYTSTSVWSSAGSVQGYVLVLQSIGQTSL
jgi:CheY-like chemotaxis protein